MKLSLAFDKLLQQGLNLGQFVYPSTIKAPKDYRIGSWKIQQNHQGARDYLFWATPDRYQMKDDGCYWMTED